MSVGPKWNKNSIMSHFQVFGLFKWCLQMNVVMYGNYIKWMQIFGFFLFKWCLQMNIVMYGNYIKLMQIFDFFYKWMYNLCDYLRHQCVFFYSNNVGCDALFFKLDSLFFPKKKKNWVFIVLFAISKCWKCILPCYIDLQLEYNTIL